MRAFQMFAMAVAVLGAFAILQKPAAAQSASSPGAAKHESPFACDRLAFTPEQRKRHFDELGPTLRSLKKGVRELPDGYEFQFSADAATLELVAEWAAGEHLCCPFLDIDLMLEREDGPLWVRLTGREGVKKSIELESSFWLKQ